MNLFQSFFPFLKKRTRRFYNKSLNRSTLAHDTLSLQPDIIADFDEESSHNHNSSQSMSSNDGESSPSRRTTPKNNPRRNLRGSQTAKVSHKVPSTSLVHKLALTTDCLTAGLLAKSYIPRSGIGTVCAVAGAYYLSYKLRHYTVLGLSGFHVSQSLLTVAKAARILPYLGRRSYGLYVSGLQNAALLSSKMALTITTFAIQSCSQIAKIYMGTIST